MYYKDFLHTLSHIFLKYNIRNTHTIYKQKNEKRVQLFITQILKNYINLL